MIKIFLFLFLFSGSAFAVTDSETYAAGIASLHDLFNKKKLSFDPKDESTFVPCYLIPVTTFSISSPDYFPPEWFQGGYAYKSANPVYSPFKAMKNYNTGVKCYPAGVIDQDLKAISLDDNVWGYIWGVEYSPKDISLPSCPLHDVPVISSIIFYTGSVEVEHTQCHAHNAAIGCTNVDDCTCPDASIYEKVFSFYFCRPNVYLSKSEFTLKTENKLLAQANSNLDVLTNAADLEVSLYDKISNNLTDMLFLYHSKDKLTDEDMYKLSEDQDEKTHTDKDKTIFSNSDFSDISPTITGSGSCPAPISLSLSFATDTRANTGVKVYFDGLCIFARKIHNVVILAAQVSSALFLMAAL